MPRARRCGFWALDPPSLAGFFTFTPPCITYINSGYNLFSTAGTQPCFSNVTSLHEAKEIFNIHSDGRVSERLLCDLHWNGVIILKASGGTDLPGDSVFGWPRAEAASGSGGEVGAASVPGPLLSEVSGRTMGMDSVLARGHPAERRGRGT